MDVAATVGVEHPTGLFGSTGYHIQAWAAPDAASQLAADVSAALPQVDVLPNPHLTWPWARAAVTAPALLDQVTALLGPAVAVENTFLITKWPGRQFAVPPHQDGVDSRIELDPQRAVSVWLAITNAPAMAGCLDVVAGSHLGGYLPYQRMAIDANGRRPWTIAADHVPPAEAFTPVPVLAGHAIIFDVRLVHRSGVNVTGWPRLGLNIRYVAPNAFRRGHPAGRPGWLAVAGDWPDDSPQPHSRGAQA